MLDVLSQRLLQVISTKGVLSDEEMVKEVVAIFGVDDTQERVQMISRKLEPLNFAIKTAYCELTGKKYWIFTAHVIDKAMTFSGTFTDVQLEFIRKVLSEIINSEDGHTSTLACINVRSAMTGKLSPTDAEELLNLMLQQKWIHEMNGEIYMGVRSIGGLMTYFKESYADDLTACPMCSDTVFHGYKCDNCQGVSHLYCLAKAAKIQRNLKCMGCNARLEVENLPTIDEDLTEVDDEAVNSSRSRNSGKSSSRKRKA